MCTTALLSRVSDFRECPLSQGSTIFRAQPRYQCETRKQSLGGRRWKGRLTLLLLWLSQEPPSASWGAIPRWKGWSLRQVWHSGGSSSESPGGKCITVDPGYLRLVCGCFSTLTIGLLIHLRTCQHRKKLWTPFASWQQLGGCSRVSYEDKGTDWGK